MNMQSEKKILINWISDLKDEPTLRELMEVKDCFDNVNAHRSEEFNSEHSDVLDAGTKNTDQDHFNPYEHLKEDVKNWLLSLIL